MTPGRFDWVRLTLRLHRFELFAFGAAIIALVMGGLLAAAYVDSLRPPPECLSFNGDVPASCEAALRKADQARTYIALITSPLLIISFAIGLFLGVPIIARELERGTVRLAWWLAPSRWRWYLARLVPILVILVVLTFAAGFAMDRMFAASNPSEDISKSFDGFGVRGGLIASQAVFIFAVAVVVGSFIGRALPAVIVAALIAAIGITGGLHVQQKILATEAVTVPIDPFQGGGARPGDMYLDQKFVLPDGTLVGYEYFNGTDPYDQNGQPIYPQVALVIPGERYQFVEAREGLALAGGSLVALLIAGFVVVRRRPG
jgi:ABC-type transport system involved in multi-copper enzyme maturation permease subunit